MNLPLCSRSSPAKVESHEIALLPRHWAWLARQPCSASATIRRLVEEASRDKDGRFRRREAQETCHVFLFDMAGDRPGFEDATRALFAGDKPRFEAQICGWPVEIREQALALAEPVWPLGER